MNAPSPKQGPLAGFAVLRPDGKYDVYTRSTPAHMPAFGERDFKLAASGVSAGEAQRLLAK